jgi:tetratricopeptide (TPR) repeat protein
MIRRHFLAILAVAAISTLAAANNAQAQVAATTPFDTELLGIQTEWAKANYSTAADKKQAAFEALNERAAAFAAANPKRAEALIWQGIILSSYAGAKGGLGALSLVKQSRAKLEAAMALDAKALDGSAYTSLGTLYYKVPGFPLGFGDKKKARQNLEAALKINPNGIDPNYFYADFLFEQGDYAAAIAHGTKALAAPPRAARESADKGRRAEIEALIVKARAKMS